MSKVRVYRAEVDAAASRVRIYRSEVDAASSRVRIYRSEVSTPDVPTSRVRIYRSEVTGAGGSKVRVYRSEVDATADLVANAGTAQSVQGLDRVILDGSASTGPIDVWEWTQDSGPPVIIANAGSRYAAFTAPGILRTGCTVRVRLRVQSGATWSAPSYQTITVARHRTFRLQGGGVLAPYRSVRLEETFPNQRPTAVIGADQTVPANTVVTIGGTDTDVDGTIMARTFTQTSGPAVTLSGAGSTRTFTPTTPGTYAFTKTATDDKGAVSLPVSCTVTVTPSDIFVVGTTLPNGPNSTGDALAGVTWTVIDGNLNITTPGTYEFLDVKGCITISASNVLVRKCRARGRLWTDEVNRALINIPSDTLTNVRVEQVEAYHEPTVALGTTPTNQQYVDARSYCVDGIKARSGVFWRCQVHHTNDTAVIWGSDAQLLGCYLWGNVHLTSNPAFNGGGSHDDGCQVQGGTDILLDGCNIEGGYNGGVLVTQDVAKTTNLVIKRCWLGNGGATINVSEKGRGALTGLVITDNRFFRPDRVGAFAILIANNTLDTGHPVIARNVYDDDGTPVVARRGG